MSADIEALAQQFRRRFPVKLNGDAGTYVWERGDRPPTSRYEPARSSRGGRRGDGVSLCMTAYHAALGDKVMLRTIVSGKHRTYELKATPAEAAAWLEWQATRPGFNLLRGAASQWLMALRQAQKTAEES